MKGRESGMPDRDYWESFFNPSCIVERLECSGLPGDIVEFGCGYGTFTIPTARLNFGTVYALDIEKELVSEAASNAVDAGLRNVVAESRDILADGCGRPDGSLDYAMLFNILHVENPISLLREAHRVLKPNGMVGIIHWRRDIPTPRGPSPDIRPTAEECRSWGEAAGLQFVRYESLCCCSWHWGLLMRRP
ncbi:MAG: class I SAM-dependent methyltransferase [Planctomycetes bacterium]|nr:class I SAM-dependent methyltransferase [Planctomycetota bacterium]